MSGCCSLYPASLRILAPFVNPSCGSEMRSHLVAALLVLLTTSATVSGQMTDQMRQEALDAHNYLRENVYPEAVGMTRLRWSKDLEALAEKAARRCIFEHTSAPEYSGKGENMYLGGKGNFTEILTMMYLERELYDFDNARCLAGSPQYTGPYGFFQTCGHYLQIVRSDMSTVGCSINRCENADGSWNNLAVCEYESMYKEPPYRARKPGEDPCELCGFDGYATVCDNGMCTVFDPMKPPAESKARRKCLNCGKMQYYGSFDYCMCDSNFYGDVCEKRLRNELPSDFLASCNKCQQEAIECQNGGIPQSQGDTCVCKCPAKFTGQFCETDLEEEEATLHLYLGGDKRFYSYYPVDKSKWRKLGKQVEQELSTSLSNYCSRGRPRVSLTSNYPATTMNGSLKVGLHAKCGRSYISKQHLKEAFGYSEKNIGKTLETQGLAVVDTE